MNIEILASCECGKAQFKTTDKPILQLCCHCADCRQATGDDASTIVFFKLDKVQIGGDLQPMTYMSDLGNQTQRLTCEHCKQVMFDKSAGFPHMLGVIAQRIAKPFVAAPQMHVWTKSKLPNVEIPKQMKQFEKGIS
ncbi:MAG: GFA family protein [Alphaproteobacteria bacterium]|nr:GFA family protein [Alphaproteobacteria bacterium]